MGCLAVALLVWGVMKLSGRKSPTAASSAPASSASVSPKPANPAGGDTKTRMQAADEYIDHKDYAMAEDILKQIVKAEPQNTEALQKLASVLYREDKIDESAAVLEQIPKK
ncbi:MAG TPA: tetratricopeptide repeat protein [Bryobacteraceae bacterium]|nr:tetratricopeptide repeat protein [Bryobacteraceae bacterium]